MATLAELSGFVIHRRDLAFGVAHHAAWSRAMFEPECMADLVGRHALCAQEHLFALHAAPENVNRKSPARIVASPYGIARGASRFNFSTRTRWPPGEVAGSWIWPLGEVYHTRGVSESENASGFSSVGHAGLPTGVAGVTGSSMTSVGDSTSGAGAEPRPPD